jgi:hypothetical protein
MSVTATNAVNLLIGLAVLALILVRQMQVRPLRGNVRLPLILAIIGIVELTQFFDHHPQRDDTRVVAALAGSLVLAGVLGAVRAMTVRIWIDNGTALRQGTWLTAALWIVSLGLHLGYDYLIVDHGSLSGLGSASLTLYFAVTYTIQRLILDARVQRMGGPGRTITGARTSSF